MIETYSQSTSSTFGYVEEHDLHEPLPGEECELCHRRVPRERTASTPPTRPLAYRVPTDEVEAHREVLSVAAKFLGCYEQPYWQFKTLSLALALVLQDESLRGFSQRGA